MLVQYAWRNIWRNTRRTTIILIAVIIGVWSMIFLGALMRGMVVEMIDNNIATLTGHIQIHRDGYRNDPVVENSMDDSDVLEARLKEILPPDSRYTLRLRVDGIASNARHSRGLTLVGIDPAREDKISFIGPKAISSGRYLKDDDKNGIVVGQALVENFETRLGHKLVLMSQDTQREIASRAFRIVGIFRAEMEATEKQYAFITRSSAQKMLKLDKAVSEISIILKEHGKVNQVTEMLRTSLPATLEILTWRDLLPILIAYLDILNGFVSIWYIVVFIAMGFGIVNTTLMAVFERMREFGLLKAMGMRPWAIIKEVLAESFIILVIGMLFGNVLAFLSIWALSGHGIDLSSWAAGMEYAGLSRIIYPALNAQDVTMANLVVLVLGLIISLYPAAKAARFTPVEALKRT
ncbi:ABC transporter permease [Thermodesulfobacteriota bacterium]